MRYGIAVISMLSLVASSSLGSEAASLRLEKIKYGDMNSWVTRTVGESRVIGGNKRTIYEIGPNTTIAGENKAYTPLGGSPWGTSNVYAHVSGISKGSNAVYPDVRSGSDRCAKLTSKIESLKVLGLINLDVMVSGSIFLGHMIEPITSTKNPYAKMEMGIPYTKRPKALVFDYKVDMPSSLTRTKATGFGGKKTLPGRDAAVVFVFLQRRWEDAQGNIHAKRVATGGERFKVGSGWKNAHQIPLHYGDYSTQPGYQKWLKLLPKERSYYARNSKGKMVPVIEEGWDDADATPTHAIVMMSAGSGEAYVGSEGLTLYVDNVAFGF
ncbi:MAG: PCMD domain-containing protein [Candidatus Amulumruptor sp.]